MDIKLQVELLALPNKIKEAGETMVNLQYKYDQLDETAKPLLSSLMNTYDNGTTSEAKLKRLAEGSEDYKNHIDGKLAAKSLYLKARVHYDALITRHKSIMTAVSLEKEKMKLV